ncbi:hypothetical protein SLS56_006363 [Neofusicoccum ribis]|uniref:AA1-like domain-containing protein n=1 Tax=Neofusicoccum ribis TaxID=45134 RepID=A0ABR3SSM9_9PEZI
MRFFAATAALVGLAAAYSETVQIKDLSVRDTSDAIQSATFTIQPDGVQCSATSAADLASDVAVVCGESAYRFELRDGSNGHYALTIYKQTAPGAGLYGSTEIAPYCHAGGNGQDDFVCQQTGDVEVTISN